MMTVITGIGWITQHEYGNVINNLNQRYSDPDLLHSQLSNEGIFLYPVKNFGRFDAIAKMTCCAVALAFYDAKIQYSENHKYDIGILGANSCGSFSSNLRYFKDYVETGRTLARGNLFIYTLPSSPLAEVAIYFGCQGPLLYMHFPHDQFPSLLSHAERIMLNEKTTRILAVKADEQKAVCFLLAREADSTTKKVYSIEAAIAIIEKKLGILIKGEE